MSFSQIAPRLEKRTFAAGRIVFDQGEPGDCAYLVDSGEVAIYQYLDGRRVELGTVAEGEIFGELGAIDGGPRMASAVALTRIEVTRIPREVFERKVSESDRIVRIVLGLLLRSIRASHRTFLRRPRSVPDHLRLIEAMVSDLHAFCRRVERRDAAESLECALAEFDMALIKLQRAAAHCPDKRHDMFVEDKVDADRAGTAAA